MIKNLQDHGIENVLALRGDRNPNIEPKKEFQYASDLVAFVKEHSDFGISGACYPECHPESKDRINDIFNLKTKVDAGATHLITQLFFDNEIFYDFVERTRLAGINISKTIMLVYAISGLCAACGGLIYGSRLMVGYPTAGRGEELFFSIAGAVVGGVSLFGGIGTILGAMIGAVMIASISNLMNVMNVSAYWQPLVIGVIILIGVIIDTTKSFDKTIFKKIFKKNNS